MSSLKERIGQMPTMARIGVVVCSVLAVGSVFMYSSLSSDNALISGAGAGKVDVNFNPSKSDISKDGAGEKVTTNSEEIKQVYEQDRKNQRQEAEENPDVSYVETLALENAEDKIQEAEDKIEALGDLKGQNQEVIPNEQFQKLMERKKLREQQERLRQQEASKKNEPAKKQVSVIPAITAEELDAFLLKELEGVTTRSEEKKAIEGYALNPQPAQSIVLSSSADNNSTGASASGAGYVSYSQQTKKENVPMIQRMTQKGRLASNVEVRKASAMDNMQSMRNKAGAGTQGLPTNPAATSYASLVDPVNLKPQNAAEHITAGTVFYSVLEIGVNTDEISPVRATIVQEGPLKGAVLLGQPERRGEKAMITFNNMSIDGKDVSINAIALDLDTMRSALADDVDRHIIERYGKLITAAMVQGYAESLVNTSTVTNSDGSTEKVSERLPNTRDQMAYAIGRAGEELVPIFEDEFQRKPTVYVDSNKEIGIMFMAGFDF
ncbi:TrbI/VirB10 family protein [Vibrio owensii]|uniref:DotG/IcmE/VirB10 family protein n=1 Tax=Vibrio harveyi group TaxID=717610 RepID=UPI003CC58966